MTNSQRLAAVRRCLDRWLEAKQQDGDIEIRDAVLIRSGFYVGRKFELGSYRAEWFMEEDEIKVHDATGSVVAKFNKADIDEANRHFVVPVRESQPLVVLALATVVAAPVSMQTNEDDFVATIPMQRAAFGGSSPADAESGASSPATTLEQPVRRAA